MRARARSAPSRPPVFTGELGPGTLCACANSDRATGERAGPSSSGRPARGEQTRPSRIDGLPTERSGVFVSESPSEITPDVVRHLAGLARIALTDDEIVKLTGEL